MISPRRASAISWGRAHQGVTREYDDVELPVVRGALPAALRGTLFRAGPGRLSAYGVRYQHLFDGDGHVTRFHFDGRSVRYRDRYVRTREFLAEQSAGRVLFRSFGTNKPGGVRANAFDPIFKNAANTSAFVHGDRLYALWEAGLPHRLDPDTLETLARDTFDGQLVDQDNPWTRIAGRELPFSAHPRVDPDTGELFNFGLANGPRQRLLLYRAGRDGVMRPPRAWPLDALYFVHDFALTKRFCVLFLCPTRFDVLRTMLGLTTPVSGMTYDPARPTRIWLVPRDGGEPIVVDAPPCFVFHHVNAFDHDDNGAVRCDALQIATYPELPHPLDEDTLSVAPKRETLPFYTRFVIDPARRTARSERLFDTPCELPFVPPSLATRSHRYAWATATDPSKPMAVFTQLAKFDLEARAVTTREFAPGFAGEPVFVPRGDPRSDDGWVLALAYNAEESRSELAVLDAATLELVCALALPHVVPPGFHGAWRGEATEAASSATMRFA